MVSQLVASETFHNYLKINQQARSLPIAKPRVSHKKEILIV
ncbi:MAG: hypothetical protein ACTMUP_00720 [cyanobacterium endosymbiont of Rhopalodia musculus]